jgi:hypothetical protein
MSAQQPSKRPRKTLPPTLAASRSALLSTTTPAEEVSTELKSISREEERLMEKEGPYGPLRKTLQFRRKHAGEAI